MIQLQFRLSLVLIVQATIIICGIYAAPMNMWDSKLPADQPFLPHFDQSQNILRRVTIRPTHRVPVNVQMEVEKPTKHLNASKPDEQEKLPEDDLPDSGRSFDFFDALDLDQDNTTSNFSSVFGITREMESEANRIEKAVTHIISYFGFEQFLQRALRIFLVYLKNMNGVSARSVYSSLNLIETTIEFIDETDLKESLLTIVDALRNSLPEFNYDADLLKELSTEFFRNITRLNDKGNFTFTNITAS